VASSDRVIVTGFPPASRIRRVAAVVGTLSLVFFLALLLKVVAKRGQPVGPDEALERLLTGVRTGFLTGACKISHWMGHPLVVLSLGAVGSVVAWKNQRRRVAWLVLAVVAGATTLAELIKSLVGRARPDESAWLVAAQGGSFPSGHSTSVAAISLLGVALAWNQISSRAAKGALLAGWVLLSLATGLSRVYLGVHYPSDVVAGGALGTAWLCLCWLSIMKRDSSL
jgi:membrane-associated phospholipid phosphatase